MAKDPAAKGEKKSGKSDAPRGEGKAKGEGKGEGKGKAKGDKGARPKKAEGAKAAVQVGPPTPPRLRQFYKDSVVPAMMQRFSYGNRMQVPRLEKIVVNMGVGEALSNSKVLDAAVEDMRKITGQQPQVTRARKSISNFKLREGVPIGCRVTLRGARMYEFFDRFVNVALPRIRDFRGVASKSFDGRGNYTLGLKEQINFPEIDYDKIMQLQGMDITVVTNARSDEESKELLSLMNMPFRK
jgi:large subunit ribosomal protein L5